MSVSHRRITLGTLSAWLLAVLLVTPSVARAADIVLQDATTAEYPTVGLDVALSADLIPKQGEPEFTVLENGIEVRDLKTASAIENRTPIDVLLLIDTSGSMKGGPLRSAKLAASTFVGAMGPSDRVALVAFSSEPQSVVDLTSDSTVLRSGIDSLAAEGQTALYDGLIEAARTFQDGDRDRYIVVLSDGGDTTSINNVDAVVGAIEEAGTPIYAVALSSPDYDPSALQMLAKQSGGKLIAADKAERLTGIFEDIAAELRNLYTVTYSSAKPSTKDLEVQMRVTNGEDEGTLVTAIPNPVYATGVLPEIDLLQPSSGSVPAALAIALLFALAFGGLAYAIGSMLTPESSAIGQLDHYVDYPESSVKQGPVSSSRNRILDAVASIAERRGLTGMVRTNLERAGLPLRPNEYIFLHLLATAVAGFVVQLVWGSLLVSAAVVVLFVVVPMLALARKIGSRRKAFETQLPDVLGLIAGSLRAGWGIQQSIELVVEEIADPAASEFRRAQSEARFGLPLEQALGRMAERLDSEDFRWTVTAIAIQREVGGNLAEVLDVVATAIRQRAELRRHVMSLTAESRFSMIVLTVLPIFLLGALFVISPSYAALMTNTVVGVAALIIGLLLLLIGVIWINRLTKVEV